MNNRTTHHHRTAQATLHNVQVTIAYPRSEFVLAHKRSFYHTDPLITYLFLYLFFFFSFFFLTINLCYRCQFLIGCHSEKDPMIAG